MSDQSAKTVMTTVRVRDLPLLADVGINVEEIGRRQTLIVSIDLELGPGAIRNIADTIDYRRIAALAEELADRHIPLIETFAERLAQSCLALPCALKAIVTIDKPSALERGRAGVVVMCERNHVLRLGERDGATRRRDAR